jgi:hypothetical protein
MIVQYQWFCNGRPIFGQETPSYTLAKYDINDEITCQIRYKRRVPARHKFRIKRWVKGEVLAFADYNLFNVKKLPFYVKILYYRQKQ